MNVIGREGPVATDPTLCLGGRVSCASYTPYIKQNNDGSVMHKIFL